MDRESIGVYRLKRLLGQGGMGSVFLAHDPRLERDVALKVLAPHLASKLEFRERFTAEARACSALSHPNITTIHEVGEADGFQFIAFEHVEGETLRAVLDRDGRLESEQVVSMALALADALSYAHERGVIHRDLKPSNILLSRLGFPKILDFGLAKTVADAAGPESETLARLTQAGMVVGTIAYMSPEQALGKTVDARSDVFSFGSLLYETLVGEHPFAGSTAPQVLDNLLHAPAPRADAAGRNVAPELADIVARALRKPVTERYQRMSELAEDLARLSAPDARALRPGKQRSRGKRLRAWLTGGAAAALVAAAVVTFRDAGGPTGGEPRVAVLYFENLSDAADADHSARMLTRLLSGELAAGGDLDVVSHQRLLDVSKKLGAAGAKIDGSVASRIAAEADVSTMVVGELARAGERLMATTEVVDVSSGRSIGAARAGGATAPDVFSLASALGEQVRERLALPETSGESPAAAIATQAYRHYVRGELHLYAGELEDAIDALSAAVSLEPEFSLAQHRLSLAARWASDGPLAHQAARRAVAAIDRAPEHLKELIEANALYQDGAFSRALPLLDRVLARDENQKEALYLTSQIYVHSLRDGDTKRGIESMERILALDPGFHQVYDRLALSYAFAGNVERSRLLMERWREAAPAKVDGLRSILATLEGQPEEALGFGQAFSWIEGPLFQASAAMMASRWDVARGLVGRDAADWRSDHLRAWALRNRGVFHAYVGELDEALHYLRLAGSASGFRTHEGASAGVPASALHAAAELMYLNGEAEAARELLDRALEMQPDSLRSLYFAGRMALFAEAPEDAERYYRRLSALPAVEHGASAKLYLDALSAERSLYAGDAKRAKEIFEVVVKQPLLLDWSTSCSSAGAVIRDGLVRSHLALGDEAGAAEAMEALLAGGAERIDHPGTYAHTLYRLGVTSASLGRGPASRRAFERLLELWGDADWSLDIVDDARVRLGR